MISALIVLSVLFSTASSVQAGGDFDVSVGGAYLGAATYINQDNRPDSAARRGQFDLAANIDVSFTHGDRIEGVLQLQTGSGGSGVGFVGSENPEVLVVLTDASFTYRFIEPDISLTFGSFDTPFGEETGALTNNGDASANAFFLNSLFYSAFAGTQVGTLNTIGLMGAWHCSRADATLSVTNGTDEAADNPDGNVEVTARLGVTTFSSMRLAGSFIYSDDNSASGSNGTEALFTGWMAEARYDIQETGYIKGYFGEIGYDDDVDATKDDITIWMGEGGVYLADFRLAARVSGWSPKDDNGDGIGISALAVSPALSMGYEPDELLADQKMMRYQVGITKKIVDQTELKLEIVYDDLKHGLSNMKSADVLGAMLGINAAF
jgi:hypothetical protein